MCIPARQLMGFHNVVLHDGYLHRERSKAMTMAWSMTIHPGCVNSWVSPTADYIDTGVGCNGYVARPWMYDEMLHPTSWVATESIDFLRRRDPTKPFFLMMSFHRPHPPLDPPQHYLDRYRAKELPDAGHGRLGAGLIRRHVALTARYRRIDDQIAMARRAYYAQITHIDHHLNRMFMALFESGVLENTAIVFVADHGEMLYDHNLIAKGLPFDAQPGYPFWYACLQHKAREAARRQVEQAVELRDILPTLCELAGVSVPERVDGSSVLPLCQGDADGWRPIIHGEHTMDKDSNQWLTDGHEKYIWLTQLDQEYLFDLEADPSELHDLSAERPERVEHWRALLMQELAGREEGFVQEGKLVAGRPLNATLSDPGTFKQR